MEKKSKLRCNVCQNHTWHSLLFEVEKEMSDDRELYVIVYQLVECMGCEAVRLRTVETADWCNRDQQRNYIPEVEYYPPDTLRVKPRWLTHLNFPFDASEGPVNRDIIRLINEIYLALQANCRSLSVMGIRALIETIMIQKVGDNGSFRRNMQTFVDAGHISASQKETLDLVLEAGHATIHRAYEPDADTVISALDVVENIIESIYVNDTRRRNRLNKVPGRDT